MVGGTRCLDGIGLKDTGLCVRLSQLRLELGERIRGFVNVGSGPTGCLASSIDPGTKVESRFGRSFGGFASVVEGLHRLGNLSGTTRNVRCGIRLRGG